MPNAPLGPFRLTSAPIIPTFKNFDAEVQPFTSTNQEPGRWRFIRIDVPSGALGWDVRLTGVSGAVPAMVVRRDQLPNDTSTTNGGWNYIYYQPWSSTVWPSGNQWAASIYDWTGWYYDIGAPTNALAPPRLLMGMGRPLEAGTYYVGVYNTSTTTTTSYTIDSRGIGAAGSGRTYEVEAPDLAFNGGTATITTLTPREVKYFKVTIPANTPSWEVTLEPTVGEMLLAVRRGAIPDFNAREDGTVNYESGGQPYGDVQVEMQKAGPERYVMLPASNLDFLPVGDYYLAVVSEGVNPGTPSSTIGTGTSSGTLTSVGPLAVTPITANGVAVPVSLLGGQIKAYQFTVDPGTPSLEVQLQGSSGVPYMALVAGSRLPSPPTGPGSPYYGWMAAPEGRITARSSPWPTPPAAHGACSSAPPPAAAPCRMPPPIWWCDRSRTSL
jgi:hypothetical protein